MTILAVSVDDRERQRMMIERVRGEHGVEIDYTLLTDEGHRVIDRYGLFNPDEPRNRPVPHPTTLVVDREGIVRWKFVETDYRIRPANEDIRAALEALD